MKTLRKTVYIALLAFITIMAGCSKNDDDNSGGIDTSGILGNYDITIDGQRYSGEVGGLDGDDYTAAFSLAILEEEGGLTTVSFALHNNDILSNGEFKYPNGQDNNVSLDEEGESSIGFALSGIYNPGYTSKSGTAKIIVGEKFAMPEDEGFLIELQVEFQGTFLYGNEDGNEQTSQASGTFKVNLVSLY